MLIMLWVVFKATLAGEIISEDWRDLEILIAGLEVLKGKIFDSHWQLKTKNVQTLHDRKIVLMSLMLF